MSHYIPSIVSSHGVNQQHCADALLSSFPLHLIYLCSLQQCVAQLVLHNGRVLNPTQSEAICFGTSPRRAIALSNLTSIQVEGTSVPLVDYIKLLDVTLDSHLNIVKHISNVCSSSYFHTRALRHIRPFLDSETVKTIACAIVGFRLEYVNAIQTGISSRNIHLLQRVQNSLARVATRSTTNTTSALNSLHWLPIQQRYNFKLATLVHRSLHNAGPQYLSYLSHPYTPSRQLRSASLNLLSQSSINIALACRGFRHAGPSLWNSLPYHLRYIDSYTIFISNLKPHLFSGLSFSGPKNSIHALLIRHNHVDFAS